MFNEFFLFILKLYIHCILYISGGIFEWESTTQGQEGDIIHYWLWGEQNGQGETKTDLTAVLRCMLISLIILFYCSCQSEANRIGGVIASALASSAVANGFELLSGETKQYKIGIFAFPLSMQH